MCTLFLGGGGGWFRQAKIYFYCMIISVSDPDSLSPDPDPAF